MNKPSRGASLGALAIALPAIAVPAVAMPTAAFAADGAAANGAAADAPQKGGVNEIVVTATRRSENLQDVPVAVNALDSKELDRLHVNTFSDYLKQLPNVTAGGSGPGQNTIYIRGLASTTPNLTVAGVSGLAPNVSMYLDEQPLAQPGRNLDVYAADLQRIEVLSGPQGTLFGASSQAGVVRMITNKPDLGGFDAYAKAGVSYTHKGSPSYNAQVMLNVPVTSNFGLRGVFYIDDQGGYIDNVHGTVTAADSARFRSAGTVRENGVPVSADRAGFQAGEDLSGVNFIAADNRDLVQKNFNDTTYKGFRLSALWEFAPDWKLTVEHTRQGIDSDGVFFADPDLGLSDPSIQRYEPDRLKDDFSNTAWTVEGRVGALDLVYNGSYTDRKTEQQVDYTDYLYVGQYLPYYICDGSVSYPGSSAPSGTCQAPNLYVTSRTHTTQFMQELRVSTPQENRLRATGGVFYSKTVLKERNDFMYPGSENVDLWGQTGFPQNGPFPDSWQSTSDPMAPGGIFRNDVKRTDRQFGIYGQADFDVVPDLLTASFGMRYYNVKVGLTGNADSSFCNAGGTDENAFGTNLTDLYNGDGEFTFVGSCDASLRQTFHAGQSVADIEAAGLTEAQATQVYNALSAPSAARDKGVIFKGTVTLKPARGIMVYATYSEGFRPGLLNRPGGATSASGYTVPFELKSDTVKNYELGWKTELFGRQVRFNASAFYMDIGKLQTTIFDPSITNLTFADNAADARTYGIEGDFTVAPYATPGFTVAGAFSFLDSKITKVLTPTNDVQKGDSLAYAPPFQGNLRMRYEWDAGHGITAHVMPQVVHSAHKYTDIITINRMRLKGYTTVSLSAGIAKDKWTLEVYAENLTDKRAEVSGNFYFDRKRVSINRPRTIGVRVGWKY